MSRPKSSQTYGAGSVGFGVFMAGTWIIMHTNLSGNPKVRQITRDTGASDQMHTIGRLHAVWSWADEHSEDGTLPGCPDDINELTRCDGFAESMVKVGWLDVEDGVLVFSNFSCHNGKTAKRRAKEAKRSASVRTKAKKNTQTVRTDAYETVNKSAPTKQNKTDTKEKEKKEVAGKPAGFDWDKDCPPSLNTPETRDAFAEWSNYRREAKYRPWKPVTIRKALREFESLPAGSLAKAVDHSIKQGYQGLYMPTGSDPKSSVRPNDKNTIGEEDILAKLEEYAE